LTLSLHKTRSKLIFVVFEEVVVKGCNFFIVLLLPVFFEVVLILLDETLSFLDALVFLVCILDILSYLIEFIWIWLITTFEVDVPEGVVETCI
jgi:hypothetical protein